MKYLAWCTSVSYTHLDVYKRQLWERLIEESGSQSINEYLLRVSSMAVKDEMKKMNFEGCSASGAEGK